MKKYSIIRIFIIPLLVFGFYACNNYLDPQPHSSYSEYIAWENKGTANIYLNSFYKDLREYGSLGTGHFGGLNTDGLTDILKYGAYNPGQGSANIYAYEPTKITPDQNGGLVVWNKLYEKIRRINVFLEGLATYGTFDEQTTLQMEAQARFIRGYFYHLLTLRHGSCVLLDKPTTDPNNPRSPESDCWDFVENDLDFAAENLPVEWPASDEGRITKGAALAMKSRAMLYAKRWDKAIQAAEGVIALKEQGTYGLASTYENAFKSRDLGNKESILEFRYQRPDLVHNWDYYYSPGGDNPGYGGRACPTQELVEGYETADGEKVDWTPWHNGTTSQAPPYSQLEPRFQASVLYNQAEWKGRKIEPYVNGVDGFMDFGFDSPNGRTTTGYYMKKYLDESNTDLATDKSQQSIIEIRYAEVLLNYAEACAMAGGKESEANNAIRQIRARVGLPYQDLSGDALLQKIRLEREIELAFEGQRYWDLRRWRLAGTVLNNVRFHGLKIEKTGTDSFSYQYIECDNKDRKFLDRLYNLPLPNAELANNTAITQIEPW